MKDLAIVREPTPAGMTLTEVRTMAEAAAQSGLFPGIKSPAAAFTLMMLCQAEGLHPITALRRYHIIDGKPGLKADAMLGDFMTRGGTVTWHKHDHEECSATFEAPGVGKPVDVSWTVADAKKAGLAGKPVWGSYTRQMLRARVISEGIRMTMPAIIAGLYTPEEVQAFDTPAPTPIDVVAEPVGTVTAPEVPAAVASVFPAAKVVEEVPAVPMITSAQLTKLQVSIKGLKLGGDDKAAQRAVALDWLSWAVGRLVTSSKTLTDAEAAIAIRKADAGEMPTVAEVAS